MRHAGLVRKPSASRTAADVAELELIGTPEGAVGSAQREVQFYIYKRTLTLKLSLTFPDLNSDPNLARALT